MQEAAEPSFADAEVAAKFAGYPQAVRKRLSELRRLIFDVAAGTEGVGPIEEALRWGQPSYLTTATGAGSTVRIDAAGSGGFAIFFICNTNLVDTFRALYPDTFTFEKNRALVFAADDSLPERELAHCLSLALTYHTRSKPKRGRPRKQRH